MVVGSCIPPLAISASRPYTPIGPSAAAPAGARAKKVQTICCVKPALIISDDQEGLTERLASALALTVPVTGFVQFIGQPVLVTFIRFYYNRGTFCSICVFNRTVFVTHHLLRDFMHLYIQLLDLEVFKGGHKAHRECATTATGICLPDLIRLGKKESVRMRFDALLPKFVRTPLQCAEHVAAVNRLLKAKETDQFNCILDLARESDCPASLRKEMSKDLVSALGKVAPVYQTIDEKVKKLGLFPCINPSCSCHQTVIDIRARILAVPDIPYIDALSILMHAVPSSLSDSLRAHFTDAIQDLRPDVLYYPTGDIKAIVNSEIKPPRKRKLPADKKAPKNEKKVSK